jgi:hypothetical protein
MCLAWESTLSRRRKHHDLIIFARGQAERMPEDMAPDYIYIEPCESRRKLIGSESGQRKPSRSQPRSQKQITISKQVPSVVTVQISMMKRQASSWPVSAFSRRGCQQDLQLVLVPDPSCYYWNRSKTSAARLIQVELLAARHRGCEVRAMLKRWCLEGKKNRGTRSSFCRYSCCRLGLVELFLLG